MSILVTGAKGSVGTLLVPRLEGRVVATDIEDLDVTQPTNLGYFDLIYHLAGAKHAPIGEQDPVLTYLVNVVGTHNIIQGSMSRIPGVERAKIVMASTCKACDPETVYGASKLIAERLILNEGGVVARLYNVRETSGNVFRLWEEIPRENPIPYTDCWRYFISVQQAVDLLLACAELPSGRYTVDPGPARSLESEAIHAYPDRDITYIPRRVGDRRIEPLCGTAERIEKTDIPGVLRIVSFHDGRE